MAGWDDGMNRAGQLPDCYRKDEGSNNYKLLEINAAASRELREDIRMVKESLDIDKAFGKTLDLYGEMMGQRRGLLNDNQFRYMILARIGRNVVQGDYNSIMRAVLLMLGGQQGDVTLDDLDLAEEGRCMVKLARLPLSVLVDAGFSSRQIVGMIESLLSVGVALYADNFEGTFEFAEFDGEYDEDAGFGDIGQTIGGYLGLLLGDDDQIPVLPL